MLGSAEFGDAVVIADLEAGIGTLMRLGEERVDAVVVVVEPSAKSLEVGKRAAELARDKRLGHLIVVANRVRDEEDVERVRAALPGLDVVAVPDDPAIVQAERAGVAPLDTAPDSPAVRTLTGLVDRLEGG